MPLYDYKCAKCKKVFEVEHKPKGMPMKFCPSCGGELKRVFSSAGIVFKGSGFYVTDHKKPEAKKEPTKPANPEPSKPADTKASKS